MASSLYRRIYSGDSLYSALRKVKESAFSSSSETIRNEAKDFESQLPKSLSDIQRALSKKIFAFQKQTGVAKTKTNCSGLMKPDTHLGENARQIEVSDDQTTPFLFC
ncbi:hypothetical protein ACUN0G_12040 [Pseudomonas sp. 32A]|uniref:hypothetical protein n=1 Tax=Pseudomonas sp. 32A TaxID=651185 RepID=UPI00404651B3